MKLLEITRLLSRLDEGIDIHGLHNRYKSNPNAVDGKGNTQKKEWVADCLKGLVSEGEA